MQLNMHCCFMSLYNQSKKLLQKYQQQGIALYKLMWKKKFYIVFLTQWIDQEAIKIHTHFNTGKKCTSNKRH